MKVLNNSILFIAVLLSSCGDKNDQRGLLIKDEVPTGEVFPTKDVDAYIFNSFAGYVRIENSGLESDNWLVLNNRAIQRSGKQVIVNAANEWMAYGGSGGAHQSIISAAGPNIIDADVKQQKGRFFKQMSGKDDLGGDAYILNPGEAMTTSAGNLKSSGTKYIIHGVGPKFGSTVTADKAEVLKLVYSNIFKEMEKLHTSNSSLKELALMPISGGIFSGGDQNKPATYDVLISSIVDAMRQYEWLRPSIYTYDKATLQLMKSRVLANNGFVLAEEGSGSKHTSFASSLSASITSKLALLSDSDHVGNFGSRSVQGAAASLGSMRAMGNTVSGVNARLTQLAIGKKYGNSFFGCEFETASTSGERVFYNVKAVGLAHVADHWSIAGGLGYVCENMNTHFPNNIRQFLNQLGIDTAEFKRHGVVGDLSVQYHINIASDVSLTANVGLRATYSHSLELNPFAQVSCQASGSNLALVVSQEEVGLSLGYQY